MYFYFPQKNGYFICLLTQIEFSHLKIYNQNDGVITNCLAQVTTHFSSIVIPPLKLAPLKKIINHCGTLCHSFQHRHMPNMVKFPM